MSLRSERQCGVVARDSWLLDMLICGCLNLLLTALGRTEDEIRVLRGPP